LPARPLDISTLALVSFPIIASLYPLGLVPEPTHRPLAYRDTSRGVQVARSCNAQRIIAPPKQPRSATPSTVPSSPPLSLSFVTLLPLLLSPSTLKRTLHPPLPLTSPLATHPIIPFPTFPHPAAQPSPALPSGTPAPGPLHAGLCSPLPRLLHSPSPRSLPRTVLPACPAAPPRPFSPAPSSRPRRCCTSLPHRPPQILILHTSPFSPHRTR
jgi:hypothetical protein